MRRHNHSRRAVAALKAVLLDERFLHGMKLAPFREPFDRRDFLLVRLHGEEEAGLDQFAVEKERAGAALADNAADVRAREADLLDGKMRQELARLDVFLIPPPIDYPEI